MITPELKAKLEAQCEKYEIRGDDHAALIEWATEGVMRHCIIENIERGFMEITEWENGGPKFRLTPAGTKYVESMPHV